MVVSWWCHGVLHLQVSEDALLGKDSKEVFLKSAGQTTKPLLLQEGKESADLGSSVSMIICVLFLLDGMSGMDTYGSGWVMGPKRRPYSAQRRTLIHNLETIDKTLGTSPRLNMLKR